MGNRATRAVALAIFMGALPATLLINHLPSADNGGVTIANLVPLDTTITATETATVTATVSSTATETATQTQTQIQTQTETATQTDTATQTNTATQTDTTHQTTTAHQTTTRTSLRSVITVIPGVVTVRTITPPPGQGPPVVMTFTAPPQTITTHPTDTILSAPASDVTPTHGTPFWVYLVILGAVLIMIVAATFAVRRTPKGTHG